LKVPNGLNAVCYSNDDVKAMVAGAMPQVWTNIVDMVEAV
jgi:hypothetical protein